MSKARPRPLIALIAGYALALQVLLLPSALASAAPFAAANCVTAHAGAPQSKPDAGCPCAAGCGMHCCASVLAAPPAAGIARLAFAFRVGPPAPAFIAPGRTGGHNPQLPRAPPVA